MLIPSCNIKKCPIIFLTFCAPSLSVHQQSSLDHPAASWSVISLVVDLHLDLLAASGASSDVPQPSLSHLAHHVFATR